MEKIMRLEEYKIEMKIYYREKEQFQKLFNFLNISNIAYSRLSGFKVSFSISRKYL